MTLAEAAIWLGEKQVGLYKASPGGYIDAFCTGTAIRRIMISYYNMLTRRGELLHIEVLETEVKNELKKMAIEMSKGRLDVDGCVELCKCLHILSNKS